MPPPTPPLGTDPAGEGKVLQVTSPCSLFQSNRQPAKLNLLTCQVKPNAEDKKSFDLISRECFFPASRSVTVDAGGCPFPFSGH